MIQDFFFWLYRLFNKNYRRDTPQEKDNSTFGSAYRDLSKINYTAIFSNKLATITTHDSTMSVTGDTARAELLNACRDQFEDGLKSSITTALGTGGACLVPYVSHGRIYYSTVSQDRLRIVEAIADELRDVFVLMDTKTINDRTYYLWANYSLTETGSAAIVYKSTDESGTPVQVPEWAEIQDIEISNCDALPLAYLKCPIDSRRDGSVYGVPITYGCDDTIEQINECLQQIREEFKLKRTKILADSRLFKRDQNGRLKVSGSEFMTLEPAGTEAIIQEFSPQIRESSYYTRLNALFEQLEKQIGTSRGILTAREQGVKTATEIKASQMDTAALIDAIRRNIEKAFKQYIRACDILANAFNLGPAGDYDIMYDWSSAWLSDIDTEWNQIRTARQDGAISTAEERAWLKNEPLDVAEEAVAAIKENDPTFEQLMG